MLCCFKAPPEVAPTTSASVGREPPAVRKAVPVEHEGSTPAVAARKDNAEQQTKKHPVRPTTTVFAVLVLQGDNVALASFII